MDSKKTQNTSPEKLLSLLTEVHSLFNDSVKKEEFVVFVKQLMDSVKKTHDQMLTAVSKNNDKTDTNTRKIEQEVARLNKMANDLLDSVTRTTDTKLETTIKQIQSEISKHIETLRAEIPRITDLSDRFDEIESKIPEPLAELSQQEQAEYTRNLLESIEDEDSKLSISAVSNLREELDAIRKSKSGGSGGGIIGRDIIKDYDLSPYLDGSTKTFNLPAIWNIISVDTSSFPHALRKGVDYTYTPQSITFTSEIDETTTLATGQTVILTIVSA